MSRIDVMVDIETLGKQSDSVIFQIAAIPFDIKTGEYISKGPEKTISFFHGIADIEKSNALKIDGSTLKWWLNTDKELFAKLLNSGKESPEDLLRNFHTWLLDLKNTGDVYLWGNGILFDNKMIQEQFKAIGLEYPIFYRNDRDVRTILELTSHRLGISEKEIRKQFKNDHPTRHNALNDVKFQIKLVSWCYQQLVSNVSERQETV